MGKVSKLTKKDNKKTTGAKKKGKPSEDARRKRPLHRYPSRRQFTDIWWLIPIGTWILITCALCGVSTQYADFKWMSDLKSINQSCSAMHKHLAGYVLNYQSYLIALLGSFGKFMIGIQRHALSLYLYYHHSSLALSLGFSFMLQHLTVIAMKISWYLCILTTTAYVVALWFVYFDDNCIFFL